MWLLDRRGTEGHQLTALEGAISDYAWSPDSRRLALVMKREQSIGGSQPQPIVIDRYVFKNDSEGYLTGSERRRIYLFDIATKQVAPLTTDANVEEDDPAWSPDGERIAFASNRAADPDRSNNSDIYVADAKPGSRPRRLTSFEGPDEGPAVVESRWQRDRLPAG